MAPRRTNANDDTPKKSKKGTIHPDGETYFQGERILREKVRKGRTLYLVKYRGYSTEHAQWQPGENVGDDLLEDWENEKDLVEVDEEWEGEEEDSDDEEESDDDEGSDDDQDSDDEEDRDDAGDSRDANVEDAVNDSESDDIEDSGADEVSEEEKNVENDIEMDDDASSLSSSLASLEELDHDAEGDVEMGGVDAPHDSDQADDDLDDDQTSPGYVDLTGADEEAEEDRTESQWGLENGADNDDVEEASGAEVDMMREEMEDEPPIAEGGSHTVHLQDPVGDDLTAAEGAGQDALSEFGTARIDQTLPTYLNSAIDDAAGRNDDVDMGESFYVPPNPALMPSPDFLRERGPMPTLTQILARDIEVARQERPDWMGVSTDVKDIDKWLPKNVLR